MNKLITSALALIAISISSCTNKPSREDLQAQITTSNTLLKQKIDSLNIYKKLPFIHVKNPLNSNDSILLKNPKSLITFKKSLEEIKKNTDSLNKEYSKEIMEIFEADQLRWALTVKKSNELILEFKRKNKSFCDQWANYLLNEQLGLHFEDEQDFEENKSYKEMTVKLNGIYDEYHKNCNNDFFEKIETLKRRDMETAWENFKKQNK